MNGELEQLVQLIQALYSPSTPSHEHANLQLRLQEVQASEAAWSAVGQLLANEDANVRFFAASTLQSKISRSWTLPESAHEPLRSSILDWISDSASKAYPTSGMAVRGEKVVMRKLAGAVASLSVRLVGWNDWLLEVVMRVSAGNGTPPSREAILEVLSVIVEQIGRAEMMGASKIACMTTLASSTPYLVATLSASLASPSPTEVNAALSCFTSILSTGQLFAHAELTTLYPLIVPHLLRHDTLVQACTAIEELTDRSSGVSGGAGVTRFMSRIRTEEVVTVWAASDFVRGLIEHAIIEEEATEEELAVMKLLCVIAEHFVSFLFSNVPSSSPIPHLTLSSPATITILQRILAITLFPGHCVESYDINEMASGVWLSLQEELSDVGLVKGSAEGREGRRGYEEHWSTVESIFRALADGLRSRAEWPKADVIANWPKDVVEEFNVYRRTSIADGILYPYYILRESMLESLVETAAAQIARPDSLEPLEATLYIVYSIHEAVPADEAIYLPYLFSASILGALPSTPPARSLRSTTLRIVGAYSLWFSNQPAACLEAVQFVVKGLEDAHLAPVAARALASLCSDSRRNLVPHIHSFVQVLGSLEGKVEDSELVKVIEAVASVVQALPTQEKIDPLLMLAVPSITKLASLSQQDADARETCLQQLSYLSACARGLSDPEGDLYDLDESFDDTQQQREGAGELLSDDRIIEMRTALGNAIAGTARAWSNDVEVVQALSDFIKHSTSDAIPSALALDAFSLLQLATAALSTSVSPVWLSIASNLIARLARDQNDLAMSDEDVAKIASPIEIALNIVLRSITDLSSMNENPDIVHSFLNFCVATIRNYPRVFRTCLPSHLEAIVSFAERGLGLQENFSFRANNDLLIATIQQTRMASISSTIFQQTLQPHIPEIIKNLLLAIAASPRSHLTPLSEVLHACLLRFADETRSTLKILLGTRGFPTEKASDEAKIAFERTITLARTGKQARIAVAEFASVCRGLSGTLYGQASLSAFE